MSVGWNRLRLVRLEPEVDVSWREMTFAVYRHLLDLKPTVRHPEQGDPHPILPLACGLLLESQPVGLALAEISLEQPHQSELLSLFVAPELRGRGLGRALVAFAQEELSRLGVRELRAIWTAGKPGSLAFERILALEGWTPGVARTVTVRFRPEKMLTLPLFAPRYLEAVDFGFLIEPWADVSESELEALRVSAEQEPWVTPGLEPWSYRAGRGFDRETSVVARKDGRVVGWVLNERIDESRLRFVVSFLDRRWSRRGGILPLYEASLKRAITAGYRLCLFVTPSRYPNMKRFIEKWIAQRADFVGESRLASKTLGG